MYIFPMLETLEAMKDHIDDPEDTRKLLHLEVLMNELHSNLRKEVIDHGLLSGISEENTRDRQGTRQAKNKSRGKK